jgi:hypothetical protein
LGSFDVVPQVENRGTLSKRSRNDGETLGELLRSDLFQVFGRVGHRSTRVGFGWRIRGLVTARRLRYRVARYDGGKLL